MDFLNNLPTDNISLSEENMHLINQILPSNNKKSIELFNSHKFDEVYDELKFSIIIAIIAVLLFSPFIDKILGEIGLKSISAMILKTIIFVIVHYILIKKMLNNNN